MCPATTCSKWSDPVFGGREPEGGEVDGCVWEKGQEGMMENGVKDVCRVLHGEFVQVWMSDKSLLKKKEIQTKLFNEYLNKASYY